MRTSLALSVTLLASAPALAQTPPADAAAQAAAVTEGEIIVTATKRAESLSDVALAVSAVTGDRLAESQINTLQDLQTVVPTVTFGNDFNQAKIFIRGVGANTSTTGSSTGVALHVDGAYVARAEAQLTSLFDLERVEVLRGPQGTLYGRNAVGGSVNLVTAKPSRDFRGYVRQTFGNYENLVTEAGIGGPINDWLQFRVAGKLELRDGYGRDPVHGNDVDDLDRKMARVQLRVQPTDRLDATFSAEYFRQNDNSGAVHYYADAFPGVTRLRPLGRGGIAAKPRDLASDEPPSVETETYAFTGTVNYELGGGFSVTDIANFRKFDTRLVQDLDISAIVNSLQTTGQATTMQTRTIHSEQVSNELQLKYDGKLLNAVVGFYYFSERQKPRDQVGLSTTTGMASNIGVLATRPVFVDNVPAPVGSVTLEEALRICSFEPGTAPNRVCLESSLGTEAYAIFGQMNFDLEEMFGLRGVTLLLGGRYSDEHVDSANPSIILTANGNPAAAVVRKTTVAGTFREKTFRDFTPEIGLRWRPNDDLLFYYTYSEGFKAGSGENAAGSTTIVRPEKIYNHEAGLKAELLDRRLSVNLAGYSYSLDDLQINKTVGGGPAGFTTIFENAAKTSAHGIEADIYAQPVDGLRASASLSWTESRYDDFVTLDPLDPVNVAQPGQPAYNPITNPDPTAFGGPCTAPNNVDANGFGPCDVQLSGNRTRNSPEWAYNLHLEYDLPVFRAERGVLTLAGDLSGKSDVYFTEFNRLNEGARAYTVFDAWLRYVAPGEHLSVQAWVKNITDELRASSSFALSTGRVIGATWLPPRTYGVTIGYRF